MAVEVHTDLEAAIRSHPTKEGDYLVSWIVVGEWLHPNGNRELTMACSEQMTPWLRRGILEDMLSEEGWE